MVALPLDDGTAATLGRSSDRIFDTRLALAALLSHARLADAATRQVQAVIDYLDIALELLDDVERAGEPSWFRALRDASVPTRTTFTDAELRVVALLPTQMKTKDIARGLYVSPNTVKTHMKHIYLKLGVTSRAEARKALYTIRTDIDRKTA